MAKKKNLPEGGTQNDDLAGTVEGLAAEHFAREKAGYEARTGKTVKFVPGVPGTRTPIVSDEGQGTRDEGEEPAGTPEGEGAE